MKLFIPLLLLSRLAIGEPEAARRVELANQAFESGNYTQAAEGYRQLIDEGFASGALHYNLGSAYFRAKSLGPAVFHFRKAAELLPRDPDVRFNLGYTRARTVDKIEEKGLALPRVLPLSLKEGLHLLALVSSLFWAICLLYLYKRVQWIFWTRRALGGLFVVAALSTAQAWFASPAFGVVTAAEADVVSAPGKGGTLLFRLHEGAEFTAADQDGDWVRIALADGKKGWIKKQEALL